MSSQTPKGPAKTTPKHGKKIENRLYSSSAELTSAAAPLRRGCACGQPENRMFLDPDDFPTREQMFADPYGKSALRASSKSNPRNLPCPTCKRPNLLTPADRARGYQCDSCADMDEGAF